MCDDEDSVFVLPREMKEQSARLPYDCLVVVSTDDPALAGKRFFLFSVPFQIGRGGMNQLSLESDRVSRRHATIERRGSDQWVFIEEGSLHGTRYNGAPLTGEITMAAGDRIEIEGTTLELRTGVVPSSVEELFGPQPER